MANGKPRYSLIAFANPLTPTVVAKTQLLMPFSALNSHLLPTTAADGWWPLTKKGAPPHKQPRLQL